MLRQLFVSIAVSFCNIAIHAIVMAAVLWVVRVGVSVQRHINRFD